MATILILQVLFCHDISKKYRISQNNVIKYCICMIIVQFINVHDCILFTI